MDAIEDINGVVRRAISVDGQRPGARPETGEGQIRPPDKIELTDTGLQLSRRNDLTDVRAGLVDRVRGEIADGTYQSKERINVTVERILSDLNRLDVRA